MKKLKPYLSRYSESYLYFCYHNKLWKGLLKKGFNLRAINFFYAWKYQLKLIEHEEPWLIIFIGFLNISLTVFPIKLWVGGSQRSIGFPLFLNKQMTMAIIWLKNYSIVKNTVDKAKLIELIIESYYNKGLLWQKKKEIYENCIENRLFLRYLK